MIFHPVDSRYLNSTFMLFTGLGIDKFMQTGQDGEVADTGWPISRCSSLEMFSQLLFSFLEFTFHNICLYGICEFSTPKGLICAL